MIFKILLVIKSHHYAKQILVFIGTNLLQTDVVIGHFMTNEQKVKKSIFITN